MAMPRTPWAHAPTHQLSGRGTYFLTAGTYQKQHHFRSAQRLQRLRDDLLTVAQDFAWELEAWAVFSNHYHFVARSPRDRADATNLALLVGRLHSHTAAWVNALDHTPSRAVWHNYWDTRLTFPHSYLARLNYVHQNAVKHGLVAVANQYPWCSASWFEQTATAAQVKTIYRLKTDTVRVPDEFEPLA